VCPVIIFKCKLLYKMSHENVQLKIMYHTVPPMYQDTGFLLPGLVAQAG
jgi:hypothetical protein